jgi:hypothetical protein
LAQGFAESATLALTIQRASVELIMAAMHHDAAPRDDEVAFSARLAGRSSAASSRS